MTWPKASCPPPLQHTQSFELGCHKITATPALRWFQWFVKQWQTFQGQWAEADSRRLSGADGSGEGSLLVVSLWWEAPGGIATSSSLWMFAPCKALKPGRCWQLCYRSCNWLLHNTWCPVSWHNCLVPLQSLLTLSSIEWIQTVFIFHLSFPGELCSWKLSRRFI